MALGRFWLILFAPVALHGHCKAGTEHSGNDRRDGFHCGFAGGGALPRSPSVLRLNKMALSKVRRDLSCRLEVFSVVPIR
jgi:hypothetical protein